MTEEEFRKKVDFQAQKKEEKLSAGKVSTSCKICNKKFSSDKAYENHIKSNKHKEQESKYLKKENITEVSGKMVEKKSKKSCSVKPKAGFMPPVEDTDLNADDSDGWEDVEEEEISGSDIESEDDESEALPSSSCLFCPHESISIEHNMQHMSKSHSFFIPDLDFITDLEALLIYLGAKVGDGKICLWCNGKQFRTIQACQQHMVEKGHCMIQYEEDSMLEFADFYDFSSSYPDAGSDIDTDEELSINENAINIDPETMELILPNGARAGHRALRKYYNQNILPEHQQRRNRVMITGVNSQYKALGLTGTTLAVAVRKKIVAKRSENITRSLHRMKLGVKANNFQFHFRKQFAYCG